MKSLSIALASAMALHVAAAVAALALGHVHGTSVRAAGARTIEVDFAEERTQPVVHEEEAAPEVDARSSRASRGATSSAHVVAAAQDVAASRASDVVPEPAPTNTAPAHFKLSATIGTASADAARVTSMSPRAEFAESDVTRRARKVAGVKPVYPATAASQGLELDAPLPFEIVVDTEGRVASARELDHAGHGFDEAAMTALRTFRFSPAEVDGRPVRVRMRWTVDFHFD